MINVLPAIIPKSKQDLQEEIDRVYVFASKVQVDISDGVFTKEKTWPYGGRDADYFEKLRTEEAGWPRWEEVDIEIHLMVEKPEEVAENWIHTGIAGLVFQIEATENPDKIFSLCEANEVEVGVAIKPSTDISRLESVADKVAFIQIMGSNALGRHGVVLEDSAVEMIQKIKEKYPKKTIAIDIGVSIETKERLIQAGATKFVVGSAIFEAENPEDAFYELSYEASE